MIAATLDRITVAHASHPVFTDLSWEIHDDRVVGLVGPNGCGKSTILQTLAEVVRPKSGTISRKTGLTVGYLAQHVELPPEATVFDTVRAGSLEVLEVEAALAALEVRLGDPEVYENADVLTAVLAEQEALIESYDRLGGPGLEARIRSVLSALGFTSRDFERPVGVLSGGQKKMVGLAVQAVRRPDLLLLDEPDNHLDLAGKSHLERFLRTYEGGVVLVSHDRYLLDLVVDEIVELEAGTLTRFPGNYSEYAIEKEHLRARQAQRYAEQQKEIARLERSAKRLMTWGRVYDNVKFIKRAQAIEKRIERIDRVDRPSAQRTMDLRLNGWRGSTKVLAVEGVEKSYSPAHPGADPQTVLRGLDLLIRHGERVGLVGENGSGKSVLFRLILGLETPSAGTIALGPSVRVGHYAQEHETLDLGQTLIENVRRAAGISDQASMHVLNRFAFSYDQARRPAGDLSGGERSRLQLALIVLGGGNFLMLDEPTNNIDIASAEVLEEALDAFEGSVLVISHDRYFLDRVVDRIVELRDGRLIVYAGGYSAYAEKTGQAQSLRDPEEAT